MTADQRWAIRPGKCRCPPVKASLRAGERGGRREVGLPRNEGVVTVRRRKQEESADELAKGAVVDVEDRTRTSPPLQSCPRQSPRASLD